MERQTLDLIIQIVSLLASTASLVLALVAIWLAFKFNDSATRSSEKIEASNSAIGSSVKQLDRLFESLRSDAFGLIRGTWTALERKFLSDPKSVEESEKLAESKISEKLDQLRTDINAELTGVVDKIGQRDSETNSVRARLEKVVDKAIVRSSEVDREVREENIKDHLMSYLKALPASDPTLPVIRLAMDLRDKFSTPDILKSLIELRQEGKIQFDRQVDHWTEITGDVAVTQVH